MEPTSDIGLHAFTVFTPTRDRATTLHRVHDSLVGQTFPDFEWLVVDDGSNDGTAGLVEEWRGEAAFPIRLIRRETSAGKFEAMRTAVDAARGRLFLTLDSDDACVPDALERLFAAWESIPPSARDGFSAVTGLCVDESGQVVGSRFPRDPIDSNSLEIRYRYRVLGEKWGFQRTDVLRAAMAATAHIPGFVPEGYVWDAIARTHETRYVNQVLRIYHRDQADRLSEPADLRRIAEGSVIRYAALLNRDLAWFRFAPRDFWYQAAIFARLSLHAGHSVSRQWRSLRPRARLLWLAALPAGIGLYIMDVVGIRKLVLAARRRAAGRER
jgi:glycosyltransferase involved in cell wall biosynthesis